MDLVLKARVSELKHAAKMRRALAWEIGSLIRTATHNPKRYPDAKEFLREARGDRVIATAEERREFMRGITKTPS